MRKISAHANVIIRLHERGYIHDFIVIGKNIWWIQENCCSPIEDFKIMECHEITGRSGYKEESFIYGLLATCYNVKGILIDHFRKNKAIPFIEL